MRNIQHRKHSPVVDAAAFGHLDVVRCLVSAGFSATLPNSRGVTPLEGAIKNGHIRITRFLIEQGVLGPASVGSAIQTACAVSSLETVQLLIDQGDVDVAAHPKAQEWLQQAIELESRDIIDFLLERGASLKQCSMANVIRRRNEEFTGWLIERGAEIAGGGLGEPPIVAAIRTGDFSQINGLMQRGAVLSAEIIESHPECIDAVIKRHDCKLLEFLLAYKPDFTKDRDRSVGHLVAAVHDYLHAKRLAPEKRKTVYWKLIEMPIGGHRMSLHSDIASTPEPITIAIENNCVELLELFEKYGLNFGDITYSLTDLTYGAGEAAVFALFEFLDSRGAQQTAHQHDGDLGLGRAIGDGISKELFDFLLTRVKSTATSVGHWMYQSALDACARQQNEKFAVKLLEFGFAVPMSYSFHRWAKWSSNRRLQELTSSSIWW
jgi:hypothetical protein